MPRARAPARLRRCRSPIAFICCRTWPRCWKWCSPSTPKLFARSIRPAVRPWARTAILFSRLPRRRKGSGSWLARATSGARLSTSGCGHSIARVGRETGSALASASVGVPSTGICAAKPFPERRTRRNAGRSQLDPWQSVVMEHWNDGRRNGRTLLRDLQRLGYRGSYATLMRYLRRLQAPQGSAAPARSRLVLVAVAPRRELTPRSVAWTVLRREERRNAQDQEVLAELRHYNPELAEAIALAEEFAALVRERKPERLDFWLQRAQDGTVVLLRRFAKRLSAHYQGVRAAGAPGCGNGPVEGQINRLKMLKRTMYGRAGLDLLGRRFLLAA